jgi:hypothetical protein
MDDRRLTLIVVPHGDLETRTFEIPYRRLKLGFVVAGVLILLLGVIVASWFPVAAQAGRVPGLERELSRLEGERARVAELAQMLAEVEAQYERVRVLLGAEGGAGESVLPPLRPDTSAGDSDPQEQAARSPSPNRSAGSTPRQPEG